MVDGTVKLPGKLKELNQWEKALIQKFKSHPIFEKLKSPDQMPIETFRKILLQRRFVSLSFTVIYDMVIDGLTKHEALVTARTILRQEYPSANGTKPSHRELLVSDLTKLGVSKSDIIQSRPSEGTQANFLRMFNLVNVLEEEMLYQIRLLTILRFWGEVLVSEEYRQFWERMQHEGLVESAKSPQASVFYFPHYKHDERLLDFGDNKMGNPKSHADRLGQVLQNLLRDAESDGIEHCAKVEREITEIKYDFYNQFL